MKFVDKNGKEHNTYLSALVNNTSNKINNFIDSKIKGVKETKKLDMDEIDEYYFDEDDNYDEDDMRTFSECQIRKEKDDVFIPGVSNKIKRNKKHSIRIDYNKHLLILEDENGDILSTTQMDSRLENCPIKDIINMVYETVYDDND